MNLKLNIAIDDVNPTKSYRLLGEPAEKWLQTLHDEFGVKFNLFIPSNYHNLAPLSKHKEWVRELASIDWLELCAHGHYHQTTNPQKYGECEFLELNNDEDIKNRLWLDLDKEWTECGFYLENMGWRNPGWLCSEKSKIYLERTFKYAAIHYEHNNGLQWNCRTFFGHDGIQQEHISIHNNDMIMFQSHIAGNHNLNVWNEQNFEQLRLSLEHLFSIYQIQPVLLKECL